MPAELVGVLIGMVATSSFLFWFFKKAAMRNGVAKIDSNGNWKWKDVEALEQEIARYQERCMALEKQRDDLRATLELLAEKGSHQ